MIPFLSPRPGDSHGVLIPPSGGRGRGGDLGCGGGQRQPARIVGSVVAPLVGRRIGLPRALSVGLVPLLVGFVWLTLNPVTDGFSVHLVVALLLSLVPANRTQRHPGTTATR